MKKPTHPKLEAHFFKTESGREPVRAWLKRLGDDERKRIGDDIRTVQFGWPVGMPLVRKLESGLWEVRTDLANGIARVIFTTIARRIVLLHGFIKKSQKTPATDLDTARERLKQALLAKKE